MTDEKLILFYLVFGEILVDIDTRGEGGSTLSLNTSTSSDVLEAVDPSPSVSKTNRSTSRLHNNVRQAIHFVFVGVSIRQAPITTYLC